MTPPREPAQDTDQEQQRLETSGIYTAEGELGRPYPTGLLWVPRTIHVKEDGLVIPVSSLRRRGRWVQPGEGLLERFVSLGDKSPESIRAYALAWGLLGIWTRIRPDYDLLATADAEVGGPLRGLSPILDFRGFYPYGFIGGKYREPLDVWRYLALQARTLLEIAARLHDGEKVPKELWRAVFALTHRASHPRTRGSVKHMWALVATIIDEWLILSNVRPGLMVAGERVSVSFNGTGLVGYLAAQLLLAATRAEGFTFCSNCGTAYIPRRRKSARRRNFCLDCHKDKAHLRLAQRDHRKRIRKPGSGRPDPTSRSTRRTTP